MTKLIFECLEGSYTLEIVRASGISLLVISFSFLSFSRRGSLCLPIAMGKGRGRRKSLEERGGMKEVKK